MSKSRITKHEQSQKDTAIRISAKNSLESRKTLQQQLPGVETVEITINLEHESHPSVYKNPNYLPAIITCRNRLCTGGGFPLLEEVNYLVKESTKNIDGTMLCNGQEKIGRTYRKCMRWATFKGIVTYKKLY